MQKNRHLFVKSFNTGKGILIVLGILYRQELWPWIEPVYFAYPTTPIWTEKYTRKSPTLQHHVRFKHVEMATFALFWKPVPSSRYFLTNTNFLGNEGRKKKIGDDFFACNLHLRKYGYVIIGINIYWIWSTQHQRRQRNEHLIGCLKR